MRALKTSGLVALLLVGAAAGCGGTDQINWHGGAPPERTWVAFPPMNTAHAMAASVAVGNAIYVISGGSCAGAGGGVEYFESSSNGVRPMNTPPPVPRAAASALDVGGKVYFVGGCNANAASGEVDVFDFFSQVWSQKSDMTPRYGFASGVIDDHLYVAGGADSAGNSVDAFESYDPQTDNWTSLPPLPHKRQFPGGAVVDGKLFVIGGHDSSGQVAFSDVDIYDPATNAWTSGRPMPTGRAGGAVALAGQIYVVSGTVANGITVYDVQVYDPFYDIWFDAPPIPTARIAAQPVAIGSQIFVAGNVDPGETTTGAFEVLLAVDDAVHAGAGNWNGECNGGGPCGCSNGSCNSSNNNHHCGCDLEQPAAPGEIVAPFLFSFTLAAYVARRRRRSTASVSESRAAE